VVSASRPCLTELVRILRNADLLPLLKHLTADMQAGGPSMSAVVQAGATSPPLLVKWLCLSLGRLVEDQADLIAQVSSDALSLLSKLLLGPHAEVRAAAVFALSICIQVGWDSFPSGQHFITTLPHPFFDQAFSSSG
jgi:hypothetical protein